MNYLGRFINNFRYAYNEINAATLTGAIDVIVVEQPDGTFTCSPFHVRFGKLGVLRSREKIVEIEINGEPSDIYMKLGESGEGFFVEELEDGDDIPEYLVCSPIPCVEASQELEQNLQLASKRIREKTPSIEVEPDHESTRPKVFHAKTVQSTEGEVPPISTDFRPINDIPDSDYYGSYSEVENRLTVPKTPDRDVISTPSSVRKRRKRKATNRKKATNSSGDVRKSRENVENEEVSIVDGRVSPDESNDNTSTQGDVSEEEDLRDEIIMHTEAILNNQPTSVIPSDLHFFSDTEVTANPDIREAKRHFTPVQSDTEFEISRQQENDTVESVIHREHSASANALSSWRWGELPSTVLKTDTSDPSSDGSKTQVEAQRSTLASMLGFMKRTKHIRQNSADGGIYLSQLQTDDCDHLYIPPCDALPEPVDIKPLKDSLGIEQRVPEEKNIDDVESGNGPSLAQSPSSEIDNEENLHRIIDSAKDDDSCNNMKIEVSLCGSSYSSDNIPSDEVFNQHLISYDQFVNDPAIFKNPNVVFRINNKIYKWEAACPLIFSLAVFSRPLPEDVVNRLEEDEKVLRNKKASEENKSRYRRGYYSWFTWSRNRQQKSAEKDEKLPIDGSGKQDKPPLMPSLSSPAIVTGEVDVLDGIPLDEKKRLRKYSSTDSEEDERERSHEKYKKSLRLTSDQIASLNLREGANDVMFSVTSAYQGTTRCWCTLFRWRYDDKIVVSDIDGTITKSDVLGHIMPIVGNDWAQSGVARLFNRIKDNGYQLLYLSSRAIGQSKGTRKYLNSIKQEDLTLPEGPLLLNPTSLLTAFHREVIEKKPEKFKISCLRDIQALFPPDSNPFYAGYGNRINDVWAYQAVGIPIFRIFTINHRGELRHELTQTFQSSYVSMSQIADQLFPVQSRRNTSEDFSHFNYWRDPLPPISELQELKDDKMKK